MKVIVLRKKVTYPLGWGLLEEKVVSGLIDER